MSSPTFSGAPALVATIALSLALAAAPALAAPAATGPDPRATSAMKDQPNLSGLWIVNEFVFSARPSADRRMKTIDGAAPPLQPWAQALYDQRAADADKGFSFADAASRCLPNGVPLTMYDANYPMQVIQSPAQVTFLFEEPGDFRIISLGGAHPADLDPGFMGHSVGHIEGDTLVIDTVALTKETTLDKLGLPHTDQLHVVERVRRTAPDRLEVVFDFDDPGAFTQPWRIRRTYHLAGPGEWIREYVCNANQRNSPTEGGKSQFGK